MSLPEWLAQYAEPGSQSRRMQLPSLPAWLGGRAEPGHSNAIRPDNLPGWLHQTAQPGQADDLGVSTTAPQVEDEFVPPAPNGEGDIPDWLAEASVDGPTDAPAPTTEDADALPDDDVPDWLAEASVDGPTDAPAPTTEDADALPDDDVPDWLAEASADGPMDAPAPTTEDADALPDDDVPDWLAEASADGPADAPTPATEDADASPDDAVPDWLAEASAAEPTDAPTPATEDADTPPDEDVPDWLRDATASDVPIRPEAVQPEELAEEDVPDWLATMEDAGEAAATPSQPTEEDISEAPSWLTDLDAEASEEPDVQEPEPSPEPEKPRGSILFVDDEPVDEDEDDIDWFDTSLDIEVRPDEESGADLLGLSGSLLVGEDEADEDDTDEREEDAGLSLRDFDPTSTQADVSLQGQDMSALRFDAISTEQPQADTPEEIDALKDLAGGLEAGEAFSSVQYDVDEYTGEPVITERQAARIAKLEDLLSTQAQTTSTTEQTGESPIVRLVLAIVLLAAMLAPILLDVRLISAPAATPSVRQADRLIDRLDEEATVIMAFEYDANTVGELEPAAVALLEHIAAVNDSIQVVGVSSDPLGPVMAQRAFEMASPEENWFNVGYVPGRAIGIRGFTLGTTGGAPSPLHTTVTGDVTGIEATGLIGLEPDLVIVIAAQTDELRYWLEQATPSLQSDVIIVAGAGAAPLANAYAQSNQADAILKGMSDFAAYADLQRSTTTVQDIILNAQLLGGGATAAMILIIGGLLIIIERRGGRSA